LTPGFERKEPLGLLAVRGEVFFFLVGIWPLRHQPAGGGTELVAAVQQFSPVHSKRQLGHLVVLQAPRQRPVASEKGAQVVAPEEDDALASRVVGHGVAAARRRRSDG
jgi:hypothetical protein